jgi:hypothetical protein
MGDGGFLLASLQQSAFQLKSMQSSILGMKKKSVQALPTCVLVQGFL